jgi:hypothetical protein
MRGRGGGGVGNMLESGDDIGVEGDEFLAFQPALTSSIRLQHVLQ